MNSPTFFGVPGGKSRHHCRDWVAAAPPALRTFLTLLAGAFVAQASGMHRAYACTPPTPSAPTAIPRAGATNIPTSTSLIILSSGQPSLVTLTASGVAVPVDGVEPLGGGIDGTTSIFTGFWRVRTAAMLPPSADLVLSLAGPNNTRLTVTTLSTAPGYDKAQGTPANLKSLSLLRVRYKLSDIAAGRCVFAEYHGYLTMDADPAVIPGTPPDSVISTLRITPHHGGAAPQSFTFTGPNSYTGGSPGPDSYPTSQQTWMPDFDPTLEYCAAISSIGYGDLSRLAVVSNTVCAHVVEVAVPGAGDDAGSGQDASSDAAPEGGAISDSGTDTAIPGASTDARTCAPPSSSSGCSIAGARKDQTRTMLFLLAFAAIALRSRHGARARDEHRPKPPGLFAVSRRAARHRLRAADEIRQRTAATLALALGYCGCRCGPGLGMRDTYVEPARLEPRRRISSFL